MTCCCSLAGTPACKICNNYRSFAEWTVSTQPNIAQHIEIIDNTLDYVGVVRCKDCKKSDYDGHICTRFDAPVEPDDYCSYWERKE